MARVYPPEQQQALVVKNKKRRVIPSLWSHLDLDLLPLHGIEVEHPQVIINIRETGAPENIKEVGDHHSCMVLSWRGARGDIKLLPLSALEGHPIEVVLGYDAGTSAGMTFLFSPDPPYI